MANSAWLWSRSRHTFIINNDPVEVSVHLAFLVWLIADSFLPHVVEKLRESVGCVFGKGGRVVDRTGLENRQRVTPFEGSNPSPSAVRDGLIHEPGTSVWFHPGTATILAPAAQSITTVHNPWGAPHYSRGVLGSG